MSVVELTYGDLTPESLEEAFSDLANVQSLDLSGNNITAEYCMELVDRYISKMVKLESLDIKDNKIGPTGAIHLFEALMKSCPKLKYLDVNENAMQDEALFALAVLVKNSSLETLHVVTNHITPRGLPTLCDGVSSSSSIKELSLAFNVLGDEGAKIAAELLGAHPTLEVLDLSDNHVSDQGAVALAESFILSRRSRLRSLNLSVNQIGDIGFKAIGEALTKSRNANFTFVDLGCNDVVGDAGRAAFAACTPHMKHISTIDLTSCNLNDADAQSIIAGIRSTSSLTSVEWYNNPSMSLAVEKELYEAIQLKEGRVSQAAAQSRMMQRLLVTAGLAACAAALLSTVHRRRS